MAKALVSLSPDEQHMHILHEMSVKKRMLSDICKEDEGMPPITTFLSRVSRDADLSERYARAREAQITGLLEEGITLAEQATDDAYLYTDPRNGKQYAKLDGKSVKRTQLIIETRERFAKMMMPERFAQQRMDVTSGGKALPAPVVQNDNRIQQLLVLAAHRAAQLGQPALIDATPSDPMAE